MDNKSDKKFLIMQDITESNRQESDEKMENFTDDLKAMIISNITSIEDHIHIPRSSPDHKESAQTQIILLWYWITG